MYLVHDRKNKVLNLDMFEQIVIDQEEHGTNKFTFRVRCLNWIITPNEKPRQNKEDLYITPDYVKAKLLLKMIIDELNNGTRVVYLDSLIEALD